MGEQSGNANSPSSSSAAFSLLHPAVQRRLWDMGWTQLRSLQVETIKQIIQTQNDVVVSAATASGKTEAAFLPILSKIADQPTGSVRALYVGPLKALINDQFARVNELCEHLEMPVYGWHGDITASRKAKLVEDPGGVLLITPESLESIFVNRSSYLQRLFGELRFVVIDELHAFLASERGLHLRSLLSRLRTLASGPTPYRKVGLSATIGDLGVAQRFLNPDHPELVQLVRDSGRARETKLRLHCYCEPFEEHDDDDDESAVVSDETMRMAQDIVRHCRGRSNLMFANAKADVEEFADLCGQIGSKEDIRDRFLVHHGSLSAEIRQDTEATMKEGTLATAFCSSTLEMGIDIGSVSMVGQIDPPWAVASMTQRVGRSGRRDGEAQIMRLYIRCHTPRSNSDLFDRLHLQLVQAIAVTELMLEHWTEPPHPSMCDLSTLTQQIISVIAQTGGCQAREIHQRLCINGPFCDIKPKLFAQLLRRLATADVIEQMPEGDLVLGLRGEAIRKDKGFYAVFNTPAEYTVLHNGEVLGTLSSVPQKNERLLFGGRRWQVVDVDHEQLLLHVAPARGWKRPKFTGAGGEIHAKVREKMREVLLGSKQFAYADATAASILEAARSQATAAQLSAPFIPIGPRKTAVMTWAGTRTQDTLIALLNYHNVEAVDEQIAVVLDAPLERAIQLIQRVSEFVPDAFTLAKKMLGAGTRALNRKYDWLFDQDLRAEMIATDWLDLAGAKAVAARIINTSRSAAKPFDRQDLTGVPDAP